MKWPEMKIGTFCIRLHELVRRLNNSAMVISYPNHETHGIVNFLDRNHSTEGYI